MSAISAEELAAAQFVQQALCAQFEELANLNAAFEDEVERFAWFAFGHDAVPGSGSQLVRAERQAGDQFIVQIRKAARRASDRRSSVLLDSTVDEGVRRPRVLPPQ